MNISISIRAIFCCLILMSAAVGCSSSVETAQNKQSSSADDISLLASLDFNVLTVELDPDSASEGESVTATLTNLPAPSLNGLQLIARLSDVAAPTVEAVVSSGTYSVINVSINNNTHDFSLNEADDYVIVYAFFRDSQRFAGVAELTVTDDLGSDTDWQLGRDDQGRLLVDFGPNFGVQTFDEEIGEQDGESVWFQCSGWDDIANGCPTCNAVVWNSVRDNYQGNNRANDVHHLNTNSNVKHLLIKNSTYKNAWLCKGGTGSGCNGEIDTDHTDIYQQWQGIENGGYLVVQDSEWINADQQIGQTSQLDFKRGKFDSNNWGGLCDDPSGTGGIVLQNLTMGNTPTFAQECIARGGPDWACYSGNHFIIGADYGYLPEVWLIEVNLISGLNVEIRENVGKVIVVDDGDGLAVAGLANMNGAPIFYYPDIEAALAAGHDEPPMIRHSSIGWANAP